MHVIHNNEQVLLGFGGILNMMYQAKPIKALQDVPFLTQVRNWNLRFVAQDSKKLAQFIPERFFKEFQ